MRKRSLFERMLEVSEAELVLNLAWAGQIPWDDFFLNPRRLRGSDFLMRWSQGRWSEDLLIKAVQETGKCLAIPYGPSSAAPDNDVRESEIYLEKLEKANPSARKRPDLLILPMGAFRRIESSLQKIGGTPPNYPNLPFVDERELQFLLDEALVAIECENSLWICEQMPHFKMTPKPMKRLGGKLGLPKNAVLPTIIVKDEDRTRLRDWQRLRQIPIHVWHVFFDLGFGVAFGEIEKRIKSGALEPSEYRFQGPGGQAQVKILYKLPYFEGYELCRAVEAPSLKADSITDKNGHILPFVRFEGGKLQILSATLTLLDSREKELRGAKSGR